MTAFYAETIVVICINPLAPELFFKFLHILYIKCA
jgi:hypothetical protein